MASGNQREIFLAGGCFWGVSEYFSRIEGVLEAECGYANGKLDNPSYEDVCTDKTGHAETVRVIYDPEQVTLGLLLAQFFKIIDPTVENRQGNDIGTQYRTGVYYTDEADLPAIDRAFAEAAAAHEAPIVTELAPLSSFWSAEDYHQDYLKKNPGGYCHIDFSSLADVRTKARS